LADDADEMRNLVDHAAHFGRIDQLPLLVHLVEPETDKGRALALFPADRRADLLDHDGLCFCHVPISRLLSGFDGSLAAASLQFGNLEAATRSHRTGAVD